MDSLPRHEARGGALVDADSLTHEIDGGAELRVATAMAVALLGLGHRVVEWLGLGHQGAVAHRERPL